LGTTPQVPDALTCDCIDAIAAKRCQRIDEQNSTRHKDFAASDNKLAKLLVPAQHPLLYHASIAASMKMQ